MVDSRSLVVWKSRDFAISTEEKLWAPRIAEILAHVGGLVVTSYASTGSLHDTLTVSDHAFSGLNSRLQMLYRDAGQRFIYRRGEQVEKALTPEDLPEFIAWAQATIASRITLIKAATRTQIQGLVEEAVAAGTSVATIAKELRNLYGFSPERARAIARTEILGAANAATHFSVGSEYGDGLTKSWLNAGDNRVRGTHSDPDLEQRIPYRQPFIVGGSEMMFPGDTSRGAPPQEIVNCRCTVLYFPN